MQLIERACFSSSITKSRRIQIINALTKNGSEDFENAANKMQIQVATKYYFVARCYKIYINSSNEVNRIHLGIVKEGKTT